MDLPDKSSVRLLYNDNGIFGNLNDLNDDLVIKIILSFIEVSNTNSIVIAQDMRIFSTHTVNLISKIATIKNISIATLGICSVDQLLFAITNNQFQSGIMISSNLPIKDQIGFRFFDANADLIDGEKIFNRLPLENSVDISNILDPTIQSISVIKDYFFNTLKSVDPINWKNYKIVIDGGNGIGGESLCNLLQKIPQINTITQFIEPNDKFMHHMPLIEDANNAKELSDTIKYIQADFGVLLNHDGDRILFVDDKGEVVDSVIFSGLMIQILQQKYPEYIFGITYDFKLIFEEIINNKSKIVYLENSFSQIKRKSRELNIDFSVDDNGLFIYKDCNYSLNSLYTISILIEYLTRNNIKLSEAISEIKNSFFIEKFLFFVNPGNNIKSIKDHLQSSFEGSRENNMSPNYSLEDTNYRISIVETSDSRYIKIFLESKSELLTQEISNKIQSNLLNITNKKEFTDPRVLINFEYQMSPREKFEVLLNNFWFTWNPHHILPIIDLYGEGWRKNSPPEALMANYGREKLNTLLDSKNWELDQNLRLFDIYLESKESFNDLVKTDIKFQILKTNPIVYFCMEYGFVDWLQIYSGGLGILAADYIKQASDSGENVIGIGLFYHQGYLHQDFGPDGMQQENYIHQDPLDYNMSLAKDNEGKEIVIELPIGTSTVRVRAWKQLVGKSIMYLLDTNFEDNKIWEDRLITGYLYGGEIENRIRQEIVLGIGGAKLLERLGITPSIYHMNEGHSGFLIFERIRQIISEQNLGFSDSLAKVKNNLVFTNHTLKQAGNDIFDYLLFEKYFDVYAKELGVDVNTLFNLGDDKTYSQGGFSMTVFCMSNAAISNAVSKLHGQAAKNIWKDNELIPITNGVHLPTWISTEIHQLLDKYLGEEWHYSLKKVDLEKINDIPSKLLWDVHQIRKEKLINSLNSVLGLNLNPQALTIAWSRRLAQYKRPDLIIADIERLKSIVSNTDRPVQILIAGKSHPKDGIGKQILGKINQSFSDEFFKNRIEVIPGYNWQLARRMVSGADIWLNTPYRYEEACGTSGMKAAANGVIQFTTLDGWTDEVDWYKIGWIIDENNPSDSLYNYLENNIAPLYYSKNSKGFNEDWVEMMRNSIKMILRDFSSERMLDDYLNKIYSKLL